MGVGVGESVCVCAPQAMELTRRRAHAQRLVELPLSESCAGTLWLRRLRSQSELAIRVGRLNDVLGIVMPAP